MRNGRRAGFAIAFALTILACSLPAALADTLYVNGATGNDAWDGRCETWDGGTCGPKATIQAGIDAAAAGDEVVVADGTYKGPGNRNLDFLGKAITVRSASRDPVLCIIDCAGNGRGFGFYDGVGADTVVEGLTVRNGNTTSDGGGIRCCYGSPTLLNCVIRECTSNGNGGGVLCHNSSPTFTSCAILGNSSTISYFGGGGICCTGLSSPMLTNCAITGNVTNGAGGAICCYVDSSPTLRSCVIRGNSAANYGGALYCAGGQPTLAACTISGGVAASGGGVCCELGSSPTFTNCAISGNSTIGSQFGGDGGGVYGTSCGATFTNCTIGGNTASRGAGLACDSYLQADPSSLLLANCILWNDGDEIWNNDGSTLALTCCDIHGGWTGEGNIDADPLFVDPDGPDNDPNTWADNNYRLSAGSPCIDAGSNAAVPVDLLFDLDGLPRITDGNGDGVAIVDMGACERPATIIGDLNCDGVVNFGDINPFVDMLMDRVQYAAEHPGCDFTFADCNNDGVVDFGDINPFIDLLLGR